MIYKLDYVSGTQTKLYVGGNLIDDVFHLQFEHKEGKDLAYGYASQLYDAVIRGRKVVVGTFLMNFRTKMQLFTVLREDISKRHSSQVAIDGGGRERILAFQSEPSVQGKISQLTGLKNDQLKEMEEGIKKVDPNYNGNKDAPIKSDLDFPPFDIVVEFGNIDAELYGHARMTLKDCLVTTESYTVEVVGKPVSQMIRFLGRDIE